MKKPPKILFDILRKNDFSSFQINVYKEICSIPWGATRSYKWVAKRLNSPQSSRAVGQALKSNPFPLIIPCHRVIREDGTLGGFSCGRHLKKRLLKAEKVAIIGRGRTALSLRGGPFAFAQGKLRPTKQ